MRFNNVSIQVNAENMYRVASTFFPPEQRVSFVMTRVCPLPSNAVTTTVIGLFIHEGD